MSDSYKRRAAAQALAKARLQECASDVMRWKSTGMLSEGSALHAVADIIAFDWDADALRQAEAMVIDLCLARVAGSLPLRVQQESMQRTRMR